MAICPITGCQDSRGRDQLMCEAHWRLVPKDMRDAIIDAYPKGVISEEYRIAMQAAVKFVKALVDRDKPMTLFG